MPRIKVFLVYWLPVLAWMSLIFAASTDAMSAPRTSRLIAPLMRWLVPGLSEAAIDRIQFAVRKAGHLTGYALLALLLWRAVRRPKRNDTRPWRWLEAGWAIGGAALYAVTDEIHQTLVPSRQGQWLDVLVDTLGAGLGMTALWQWGRWRGKW